jgi:hypothetical protein
VFSPQRNFQSGINKVLAFHLICTPKKRNFFKNYLEGVGFAMSITTELSMT